MQASQNATFLPEFCGTRMVFVVVLLAELMAIMLTLATPTPGSGLVNRLALFSMMSLWVGLCCQAALCLLQPRLAGLGDHAAATASYATTILVTAAVAEVAWRLAVSWLSLSGSISSNHGDFLLRSIAISAIAWALALRYFYVRHQWRRRVESEAHARFEALQARIRPHFLFNCMNTIAGLTRQAPEQAERAVEDLSDLLRASLQATGQSVTLAEEIALCRGYLRIEQQRLGPRLTVRWDVPADVESQRLPALTLQPLVENAVYHGIERLPQGGHIAITCARRGDGVHVEITNPVEIREAPAGRRPGHRMAQENVGQRLAAHFGVDGLLSRELVDGTYRVHMRLPDAHPDR